MLQKSVYGGVECRFHWQLASIVESVPQSCYKLSGFISVHGLEFFTFFFKCEIGPLTSKTAHPQDPSPYGPFIPGPFTPWTLQPRTLPSKTTSTPPPPLSLSLIS